MAAINMPFRRTAPEEQEKTNPLDLLLKGLDVASKVTGIYSNVQQAKDLKQRQMQNEYALKTLQREEETAQQIAQGNLTEEAAWQLASSGKAIVGNVPYVVEPDETGKPVRKANLPEGARAFTLVSRNAQTGAYEPTAQVYVQPKFVSEEIAKADLESYRQGAMTERAAQEGERKENQLLARQDWEAEQRRLDREWKTRLGADKDASKRESERIKLAQNTAKDALKVRQGIESERFIDVPDIVKKQAESLVGRTSTLSYINEMLKNDFENFVKIPANDIGKKYAAAQMMLKNLNSRVSSDAVGTEERKVFGGLIEYGWGNVFGGGPAQFGREIGKFEELVSGLIDSSTNAAESLQAQVDGMYAPYLNPMYKPANQRYSEAGGAVSQNGAPNTQVTASPPPAQQNQAPVQTAPALGGPAQTAPAFGVANPASQPAPTKMPADLAKAYREAQILYNDTRKPEEMRNRAKRAIDAIERKYGRQ
jgi:hypothetical protein